jgi:hypothetical protein
MSVSRRTRLTPRRDEQPEPPGLSSPWVPRSCEYFQTWGLAGLMELLG